MHSRSILTRRQFDVHTHTSGASTGEGQNPLNQKHGIAGSFEDKDNDYICPICFDIIDEAYMTPCGHTFCGKCIKTCIEQISRCPRCNTSIDNDEQIFPNVMLNELILKYKIKQEEKQMRLQNGGNCPIGIHDILEENLDLAHVNQFLEILKLKKFQLEADGKRIELLILKDFLNQVRQKKQESLDQLTQDLRIIDEDSKRVEDAIADIQKHPGCPNSLESAIPSTSDSGSQEGFNGSRNIEKHYLQTTMASRRKKVSQHFEDLEQCYFSFRQTDSNTVSSGKDELENFMESLYKFTRFSSFRPLATLSYASDIYNGSSIVSSIEFDRDCDYFAIAGVTKKIKVFEYDAVINDVVDIHYPVHEMVCNSKISCVTWSSYHKNMLASSDYEGTVTLWDAFHGLKTRVYQEHEKRCWSVDFNRMDPKLLASGSDDSKVRLWSINVEHSTTCLETKANVCCVRFNPGSRFHLAYGSADHCVHYYDLRNTKQALSVFKGHKKAVSYAKFLNPENLVSASTDSQLKLWSVNKPNCLRTFKGHINEKNFVGLATDGDYVACGSENNALYVYYKGLSKQLMTYKFDTVRSVLDKDKKEDDANEFVSAVTWRPGSNVLVAANSQGTIKVLELV
ncbi:RFWD2 [Acanthosepion pharaonis]|uniref:RFWD2 n=1 Tax=Acanthosepion pharaonis TaxID=158019 RepID=A0A812BJR7_ACAPH|nr:RFWD2 [Sepia pharaonis]